MMMMTTIYYKRNLSYELLPVSAVSAHGAVQFAKMPILLVALISDIRGIEMGGAENNPGLQKTDKSSLVTR